jgi:hypothetical protein
MPTFNIFAILNDSYRFLWEARRDLAAYAFLPVVIVAVAQTVLLWGSGDWVAIFDPAARGAEGARPQAITIGPQVIANLFVSMAAYMMFAVAWHRRFLVGNEGQTVGAALRWGPRHWRFALRFVTVMAVMGFLAVVMSFPLRLVAAANPPLVPVAVVAFVLAFIAIYGRLQLVFPGAAVGTRTGLKDSFMLTRGKTGLMFGIAVLPPLPPLAVVFLVVSPVAGELIGLVGPSVSLLLVLLLVEQAFTFIGIAAGVTTLSIVWRAVSGSGSGGVSGGRPARSA